MVFLRRPRSARDAFPRCRDPAAGLGAEWRRPVVEQKDRLELRAGRAKQPQPAFLRTGVRPFVGRTTRASYGSAWREATMPLRVRATPSGPTYSWESAQTACSASRTSTPAASQSRKSVPASSGRVVQRQVDDVVRVPRRQRVPLLCGDDVVGRRDQSATRMLSEAHGSKRSDVGHAASLPGRLHSRR